MVFIQNKRDLNPITTSRFILSRNPFQKTSAISKNRGFLYGTHEPIHVQEAEKESHGAGTAWPKPSISRFLGYSGPDGACKWVIWGWESGSGSCALHSRPHLMLRVLNLDMSVVVRTTFCSITFDAFENKFDAPRF